MFKTILCPVSGSDQANKALMLATDMAKTDGDAAELILDCICEKKIDCVVMGSRGLSDMRALYLGSVSHKVLNKAPCN